MMVPLWLGRIFHCLRRAVIGVMKKRQSSTSLEVMIKGEVLRYGVEEERCE